MVRTWIYKCKYIGRFFILDECKSFLKMKKTKHFWQNPKRTAFPCTHPQAHGSISFLREMENICLRQEEQHWSRLVFLASCSYWYCAAIFHSAIFFCFPPKAMSFLLCYLYSFLIKVLWKKKSCLQDPILHVLEHMGERHQRIWSNVPSAVMIFPGVEKVGNVFDLLHAVLQPFFLEGGGKGGDYSFISFNLNVT